MVKRRMVYEGRAKTLYEGPEAGTLIQHFRDDTQARGGGEKIMLAGKGVLNNRISAHLMTKLEGIGVPTHFLRSLNMREQLVRQVEIIPVTMVIRNAAAGTFAQRLGIKDGTVLQQPVVEYYFKRPTPAGAGPAAANAPPPALVNEHHIMAFNWADTYEIDEMLHLGWRVNDYLNGLFAGLGLRLVDFRLEFGRLYGEYGELYLMLADEISPDTIRLWDLQSGEKFGRDMIGSDPDGIIQSYQEIAQRLGLIPKGGIVDGGAVNEQVAASLGEIENELAGKHRLRIFKNPTKPRKV